MTQLTCRCMSLSNGRRWNRIPSESCRVSLRDFKSRLIGSGVSCRYVMLRFDNSTLLFDERFIDYGCNKVQYIDHLRYMGYRFYIVSDAFATDVLHHDSSHRTAFLEGRSAFSKPDMSIVCYNYLYKVDQYYEDDSHRLPLCEKKSDLHYTIH